MNTSSENNKLLIDAFDYELPDDRIAKYPLQKRDSSKLLLYKNGIISEDVFRNISQYLPESGLLVYNNTKVIQARILFNKSTGAQIEVFCLEPHTPKDYSQSLAATKECEWKCLVGNLKKWKSETLHKSIGLASKTCTLHAELLRLEDGVPIVRFSWDNNTIHFAELLETAGELPIPPYLHRRTEESDNENYQTVYAKIKGSVAAPTAGLHFTPEVLESLTARNITTEELTLHVGAGTFQPVKSKYVQEHRMHSETIEVYKSTIQHLQQKTGGVIAVGTTSVRTLESLYYIGLQLKNQPDLDSLHVDQWLPYEQESPLSAYDALQAVLDYMDNNKLTVLHADTRIMIKPGYRFRVVNGMITNFHQPKSTLLLLVSAFVNGNWKEVYDYAMKNDFRFLSYGDSSLLLP